MTIDTNDVIHYRSGSIDIRDDDRRERSHAATYVRVNTVRAVRYNIR